jgi:hypothetical protein
MTARVAEGVIRYLYSNGIDYNQLNNSLVYRPAWWLIKRLKVVCSELIMSDDQRTALFSATFCGIHTA